jgi:AmmeMemoRadiSam system radical SAM enzyme
MVSHIESVPLYHFMPGSRCLIIGSAGCNLDCHYCSNAFIARADPEKAVLSTVDGDTVIRRMKQTGSSSLVFGINEPAVSLPGFLRLASRCRDEGIPVGSLTNGFLTTESAVMLGEACQAVNISLKGFTDDFFRRHAGGGSVEPVKRSIEILSKMIHLEITTPVVPGVNDGDLERMAEFIASCGRHIPWHVFRLQPEYRMTGHAVSSVEELARRVESLRKELPFIYFGNFAGSQWVSTRCPDCGETVIERINLGGCGAKMTGHALKDKNCASCGASIAFRGNINFYTGEGQWTSAS